jgi:hypothetical protein
MAKLKKETVESIKRNPIYTKDKGKVKAYADSLDAYNKGEKIYNNFLNYSDKNNLMLSKYNNSWTDNDGVTYNNEYLPVKEINKKLMPKDAYDFTGQIINGVYIPIDKKGKITSKKTADELEDFFKKQYNSKFQWYYHSKAYRYKKPIQPYEYQKEDIINPIKSIGQKEIDVQEEGVNPVQLKNKKVSAEEPEHFLDISEPDGKGTKRMYFESRKELENFQKENPMLKTGSFSRAKVKPEVLEILKKIK